jgi:hypothetical protein
MSFQLIVVVIATLVLISLLTFIGYTLHSHTFHRKFPPVTGECPDYWVSKENECTNPKNLGKCTGPKSFNSKTYKGHNGNCAKARWANNCGLSWQGITNNPNICKNISQ